jgi:hypothetical protein
MRKEYFYEDIFEDIPDDPDNVIMNIPEEISDFLELNEGDSISIELSEGGLYIKKVLKEGTEV